MPAFILKGADKLLEAQLRRQIKRLLELAEEADRAEDAAEATGQKTPAFYSVNEAEKPAETRVHHENSACPPGRDIPQNEHQAGTGGYRLCDDCKKLND